MARPLQLPEVMVLRLPPGAKADLAAMRPSQKASVTARAALMKLIAEWRARGPGRLGKPRCPSIQDGCDAPDVCRADGQCHYTGTEIGRRARGPGRREAGR